MNNNELMSIIGGGRKLIYGIIAGAGALLAFVVGIIDGYMRPLKCNTK